jgi:hypothetical protein
LPFCYLDSRFNHKISLFKRQKASNFRMGFQNVNEFNSRGEGGGEGGVRGRVEKKRRRTEGVDR